MRNRIDPSSAETRFWPPKRSNLARALLSPICRAIMRRVHAIDDVRFEGIEHLDAIGERDGVLICPNHSYTGDASVILRLALAYHRKPLHFMAAQHVFARRRVVGWMVQRLGGFSVDREGCDRSAIRTAIELLGSGKGLIVFPEGEIYHLNERLTPLREGVAFMAVSAQRDLSKSNDGARIWIVPVAISYAFVDAEALRETIEQTMSRLEHRVLMKPSPDMPLHERLLRFGEVMLTIQEKQHLGRSYDDEDEPLSARLNRLMNAMLERLERAHCGGKSNPDETVPVRVKLLRQRLIERISEPDCESTETTDAAPTLAALEDVHRVLQLYSYPGDYLVDRPSIERMAETVEKFEEDLTGDFAPPQGRRRARMRLGAPIDVSKSLASGGKARQAVGELTQSLEDAISALMLRSESAPRERGG